MISFIWFFFNNSKEHKKIITRNATRNIFLFDTLSLSALNMLHFKTLKVYYIGSDYLTLLTTKFNCHSTVIEL